MKLILLQLVMLMFVIGAHANEQQDLAELVKKESQSVYAYSGYLFNVAIVDKKPFINVIFIRVDKNNVNNNHVKPILTFNPDVENTLMDAVIAEAGAVTNMVPYGLRKVEMDDDCKSDNNKIVRFNIFDSNSKMRISEWRLEKTGFKVQSTIYGETGKLLTAQFYSNLKFNKAIRNISHPGKQRFIHASKVKINIPNDLINVRNIQRFSFEVLERHLKSIRPRP